MTDKAHPLFPFPKTVETPLLLCKRPLVVSVIFSSVMRKKTRVGFSCKDLNSPSGIKRMTEKIDDQDFRQIAIRERTSESVVEVVYARSSSKSWFLTSLYVYKDAESWNAINVIELSEIKKLSQEDSEQVNKVALINHLATTFQLNYWLTYPGYAIHGNIVAWKNWYDSVKHEKDIPELLNSKINSWRVQRNMLSGKQAPVSDIYTQPIQKD